MLFMAHPYNLAQGPTHSLRCPACRQLGTFEKFTQLQDLQLPRVNGLILAQRRCPNPKCRTHVFVAADNLGKVLLSYPAERIDFDASKLPQPVVDALEEAITCHANQCYIAAAMLVRKTLEELCRDRKATGENLKDRVKALKDKVVLPQEMLDGLHDLRLLGNDAAHIESREYDDVGQEEVEVAIDFAKEVLKAVYQYSALLERRRALKKSVGGTAGDST